MATIDERLVGAISAGSGLCMPGARGPRGFPRSHINKCKPENKSEDAGKTVIDNFAAHKAVLPFIANSKKRYSEPSIFFDVVTSCAASEITCANITDQERNSDLRLLTLE